jgi:biopolymer transport protein ExbB/TolQ
MEGYNVASLFFFCIVIILVVLFVVSFTLFIRKILIKSSIKSHQSVEIEKKLDKIIDLLEKDKNY